MYFTHVLDRNDFKSETAGLAFDGKRRYQSDLSGSQITNHEGLVGSGGYDRAGTYRVADDAGFWLDEIPPNSFSVSPDMPHKMYGGGLSRDRLSILAATNAAGAPP